MTGNACALCDAADERLALDADWFVGIPGGRAPFAGWIMLAPFAHRVALAELSDSEAATLGRHVRALSAAIQAVTGTPRTYAANWAEDTRHVHVHLVPRPEGLEEHRRGYRVFSLMGDNRGHPAREAQLAVLHRIVTAAGAESRS